MSWIRERKHGCRLQEYEQHGLHAVTLENRALRVTVLPDKGADIVELRLKALDLDVLWTSPNGLRDLRLIRPSSDVTGPFMDLYEGGWQEVLPSGGPPSSYAGASWGQHGETTTLPWDYRIACDEPDEVAVDFRVRLLRYPLSICKTLRLRDERAVLEIKETIRNEADEPLPAMWGHHPTLGPPFLSPACRFQVPECTVRVPPALTFENQRAQPDSVARWPNIPDRSGGVLDLSSMSPPGARSAEFLYLTDVPEGWFAVTNDELGAGFGMCWDPAVFRHVWYWQVARGAFGYPWFGRTYTMALEPWTSWPGDGLARSVEQGTALHLGPGEQVETALYAVLWCGRDPVLRVTPDGPAFSNSQSGGGEPHEDR